MRDGREGPTRDAVEGARGYLWDPAAEPEAEVARLEAALRPLRAPVAPWSERGCDFGRGFGNELVPRDMPPPRGGWRRRVARLSVGAAAGGFVAAAAYALSVRAEPGWRVAPLAGIPAVRTASGATTTGARARHLGLGDQVETDATSAARIAVGRIGTADVGPNSRVRLVRAAGTEHRMAIERGTLHARIWAPPRFFLVETPAALAVDLGCVYTIRVEPGGHGVLTVISGEVELVGSGRRSLVAAGSAVTMQPGRGPGTPYPVGSSDAFRRALAALDVQPAPRLDGNPAHTPPPSPRDHPLEAVLREAQGRATITLWHLLPRVPRGERARVYAHLATLAPPPAGVTRAGILALDARMLARWQAALAPTWSDERVPVWKRLWRRAWALADRPLT